MKMPDFTGRLFLIFIVTFFYLYTVIQAEISEQVWSLSNSEESQCKITGISEYYKDSMGNLKINQRDTIIYDTAGNMVMTKSSRANSGWEMDSMIRTDSLVYNNGKICEIYYRQYHFYEPLYNIQNVYTYYDGEKVRVQVVSDWDSLTNTWVPNRKDSLVCSAQFEDGFDDSIMDMFYPNFISSYNYDFDKQSSSWRISSILTKSESECDSITLVANGTNYYNETSSAFKRVAAFKTSEWSWYNRTTYSIIEQRPGKDALFEYSKVENFQTGAKYYRASNSDSSSQFYFEVYGVKDSHGNDTLTYARKLDTASMTWDTTPNWRYERTYDSHGNIAAISEYYYSKSDGWKLSKKVTYTYEIPVVVMMVKKTPRFLQKISSAITPAMIKFTGDDLIKLKIYTITGGLVITVAQQPASSITMHFAKIGKSLASGNYLAEVISQNGRYRTCLTIQR
ncbi:MAG TPA: hypothetical protein VHP36_02225 [Chitinispirillaceae bacterium]|nr:hypothetical protein [Chitinispirillaceae bacterium]